MRKILTLLTILSISIGCIGQNNRREVDMNKGIPIMVGGVSLLLAASFTPAEFHRIDGLSTKAPVWVQDAKFAGIVSGVGVTCGGLITTLLDRTKNGKGKGKRRRAENTNGRK